MSKINFIHKNRPPRFAEIISLLLIGSVFLGASLSETRTETELNERAVALRPDIQQLTQRGPASSSLLRHTQKLKGPLRVQILTDLSQPAEVGDVFELKAEVTSYQNLDQAKLTWQIPPGLEVVTGFKTTQLSNLKAHHPQEVSIFLRKLKDDNLQIHATLTSSLDSAEFADVAQFNTQHFQELKDLEVTIQQKTAEHLKSQGLRQRLFQ